MSANTYWRPAAKGKSVPCLGSFLDMVAEAKDMDSPQGEMGLDGEDIPILKGIGAANKSERDSVTMLIEAIEKHGTIYVWREY